MANNSYTFIDSCWLFFLVVYLGIVSYASEEAINILDKNRLLPKTKGTIKTIECPEDGVVIDCIDFWQQPAFDNPITKKLELMERTMRNPNKFGMRNESKIPRRYHKWNKYGECPKGTIPIRRIQKNNDTMNHHKYPKGGVNDVNAPIREYVVASSHDTYHGVTAILNIWKPYVVATEETEEMSLAQIWVLSEIGGRQNLNSIEVGWQVYPRKHGGSTEPRFFIFWTRDGYQRTRCYNIDHECPGFVVTSQDVTFDCDIDKTSIYDGNQYEISIRILRDSVSRKWLLFFNGGEVGYWPANIFTTLGDGATSLEWGGEIAYKKTIGNVHTYTEMGSGHFPNEGFNRAAYIRNIRACDNIENDWNDVDTNQLRVLVTEPNCYNFQRGPPGTQSGTYFLYGGPGGPNCDQ